MYIPIALWIVLCQPISKTGLRHPFIEQVHRPLKSIVSSLVIVTRRPELRQRTSCRFFLLTCGESLFNPITAAPTCPVLKDLDHLQPWTNWKLCCLVTALNGNHCLTQHRYILSCISVKLHIWLGQGRPPVHTMVLLPCHFTNEWYWCSSVHFHLQVLFVNSDHHVNGRSVLIRDWKKEYTLAC